jgi:hypothetical protein
LRIGDLRLQLAVVGQDQQPLAVGIEPAGNINILDRNELIQRPPLALRGELAEDAVGLVEEDDFGHVKTCRPKISIFADFCRRP